MSRGINNYRYKRFCITIRILFNTVKSKNVFGCSFVPKTRGGDTFTVTLFAIKSANPYLPNLSVEANVWATTSVKCADAVRPQEISGMRKPSLIEEYDSQGSSGMFGRYIINGVSNGSSDRTITIEKNSGIERRRIDRSIAD